MIHNNYEKFQNWSKDKGEVIWSLVLLFLPVVILFLSIVVIKNYPLILKKVSTAPLTVEQKSIETKSLSGLKLIATSAIVKQLNTGKIVYAKNADEPKPLASLTKLLTAVMASQNLANNTKITIQNQDIAQDGDYHLNRDDSFSLKQLIDFSLVNSSNDTASALVSAMALKKQISREAVISNMNSVAKQFGLKNSNFENETGLDLDETHAGAVGSAEDVAILMEYILKNNPEILEATTKDSISIVSNGGLTYNIKNTNEIIDKLPGVLGSKTGYTDIAGGNLTVVVDRGLNDPYVIVVLGSTQEGRFTDMEQIINELKK